jgi:ribosomal protein S8
MKTNIVSTNNETSEVDSWCTEEFITNNLIKYLKVNGYKVDTEVVEKTTGKTENVLIATKYFTKEIIEIKGLWEVSKRNSLLQVYAKDTLAATQVKNSITESFLNSITNFAQYYSDENASIALALPNSTRYKAIVDNVEDYFTTNNLYFKIYLIDKEGEIEERNLNTKNKDS